jgi:hypothetical protein
LEEPEAAAHDMAAAASGGGGAARVWRRLGLGGGSGGRNQV